jgi:hypothetical protein
MPTIATNRTNDGNVAGIVAVAFAGGIAFVTIRDLTWPWRCGLLALSTRTNWSSIMTSDKSTASWNEVNTNTLPEGVKTAYCDYVDAQEKANAVRKAFEDKFTALFNTPKGKRILVGYRFGKLSVAIVEDTRKSASAIDLSALLKRTA